MPLVTAPSIPQQPPARPSLLRQHGSTELNNYLMRNTPSYYYFRLYENNDNQQSRPRSSNHHPPGNNDNDNDIEVGDDSNDNFANADPRQQLIPYYLAARAYHLPGNTNCYKDWIQYIVNNHPIFGIFCRHPEHPIDTRMRLIALLGTFVCGLSITSCIWIFLVLFSQDPDDVVYVIERPGSSSSGNQEEEALVVVTKAKLVLWTCGSGIHSIFDSSIWFLMACACCFRVPKGPCRSILEKCRLLGLYMASCMVIMVTMMATFLALLRGFIVSVKDTTDKVPISSSSFNNQTYTDAASDFVDYTRSGETYQQQGSFDFVFSYFVEMILALFFFYPVTQTIMFSGILGCCGIIPILGGYPYELNLEDKQRAKFYLQQQKQQQQQEEAQNNINNTRNLSIIQDSSRHSEKSISRHSSSQRSISRHSSSQRSVIRHGGSQRSNSYHSSGSGHDSSNRGSKNRTIENEHEDSLNRLKTIEATIY